MAKAKTTTKVAANASAPRTSKKSDPAKSTSQAKSSKTAKSVPAKKSGKAAAASKTVAGSKTVKSVAEPKSTTKTTKSVSKTTAKAAAKPSAVKPSAAAKTAPTAKKPVATKTPSEKVTKAGKSESKAVAISTKPPKAERSVSKKSEPIPPPSDTSPEIVAKIRNAQASREARKDLAQPAPKPSLISSTPVPPLEKGKDRVILMVRDAFWLHAHWDITRQTVERVRVSIAEHWHTAKPIIRMLKLDDNGTTNNAETVYKDIEIHGGVRNWYIETESPGCSYKVQLGYITANGRFYELVRSNTVTMPVAGSKEVVDDHWADIAKDAERIYAMSGGYNEDTQSGDLAEVFEERLKRTMDTDVLSQFGAGAEGGLKRSKQFHFEVDAELVVFGNSHPDAHVNVGGEPVKVRPDGSFSIRLPLPDRRQVLPATAKSRDGVDEQTVVIAVERNTKIMEPLTIDVEDM